jgi:hypothetical protein
VYYTGARPYKNETNLLKKPDFKPLVELQEKEAALVLLMEFDASLAEVQTRLVTTERLGTTIVSEALFEHPDGSPLLMDVDLMGNHRKTDQPRVGPFEQLKAGAQELIIW